MIQKKLKITILKHKTFERRSKINDLMQNIDIFVMTESLFFLSYLDLARSVE
jgi:hypothetical protein